MDSLIKGGNHLFILYLVISGNYLYNLFGCRIQRAFVNNMYIKHLLGLLTLFFFVSLSDKDDKTDPLIRFGKALGVYLFFILSTRMTIGAWLTFVSLLIIMYLLSVFIEQIEDDKSMEQRYNTLKYVQSITAVIAVIVLIIGVFNYMAGKRKEYGPSFSYLTFLVGKTTCKRVISQKPFN